MTLAAIKAEAHLVQIRRKMFGANLVPSSDDAELTALIRELDPHALGELPGGSPELPWAGGKRSLTA
jgi:hypothetical protein